MEKLKNLMIEARSSRQSMPAVAALTHRQTEKNSNQDFCFLFEKNPRQRTIAKPKSEPIRIGRMV